MFCAQQKLSCDHENLKSSTKHSVYSHTIILFSFHFVAILKKVLTRIFNVDEIVFVFSFAVNNDYELKNCMTIIGLKLGTGSDKNNKRIEIIQLKLTFKYHFHYRFFLTLFTSLLYF